MATRRDKSDVTPATPKELCPALYGACLQDPDKLYSQEDLLALNVIPNNDIRLLVECINSLVNQRRFTNYHGTDFNTPLWKVVKREDAARYKGLTQEESVVLSYVDNSQKEGIWVRHIRSRSGLAQNSVNNALKRLEQKGVIKQITSAKNPARKHYMLAHLQPSEDVTGGPFFSDGALDEDYVFQISKVVFDFIQRQSWGPKLKQHPHFDKDMPSEAGNTAHQLKTPLIPGYANYPTLTEITSFVNDRGVSSIRLVEADMKQLVDLLCWDGRVSEVTGGGAFKSVQGAYEPFEEAVNTNGFTEVPCGRCPVFDWCEDTGPVNAKTCTYLPAWLVEQTQS